RSVPPGEPLSSEPVLGLDDAGPLALVEDAFWSLSNDRILWAQLRCTKALLFVIGHVGFAYAALDDIGRAGVLT
ncbi:MAG: hypothetical protein ACPGXK_14995, partial [Phycisphaerae bacterium]